MLYAATTFWLMVIVFTAWGVHRIWTGLVPPKVVNAILLPGTLVAAVGHVVGLLVTGGTVNNTALIRNDESGEPQTDANPASPSSGQWSSPCSPCSPAARASTTRPATSAPTSCSA